LASALTPVRRGRKLSLLYFHEWRLIVVDLRRSCYGVGNWRRLIVVRLRRWLIDGRLGGGLIVDFWWLWNGAYCWNVAGPR